MKQKNFITYFFIGIISIFFVMYPVMFILIKKGVVNLSFSNYTTLEKENGSGFNRLSIKVNNLKNRVNTQATNNLFMYNEINQVYPFVKKMINFYGPNSFLPLGTNSDGEFIFFRDDFYVLETNQNDDYIVDNKNKAIDFWNELSKKTDLYIYLPSRYEFRDFNETYKLRNMFQIKNDFINNLDDSIKVRELVVNNQEEYNKLFYTTDHHWNSYGALKGYQDIANMLGFMPSNYSVVVTDKEYRGSIAKMVADKDNFDYFMYIDANIPVSATIDGKNPPKEFKPLQIQERNNIFYDQYIGFYDGLYSEVVYDYGNGEESILILGDSYSWQIDYIIASHFNKTYILNPKYIDSIDLDKYLKDKNITKTLVLMETQTTIFDNYEYGYISKLGGNK